MAVALNALFDKRRLALARARLRAWWEGESFDEAGAAEAPDDVDEALFEPAPFEPAPRLVALMALWGEGRVRPGDDTADRLEPARIGIAPDGVLAVLGPGLAAPVAAIAGAHGGPIEVFEWREETFEALQHGLGAARLGDRLAATRVDLEAHVWTPNQFDGLWSVDDFAYCSYPPHLAQQIMKALKPGACAVVETYCGVRCDEYATAFASSFAEPHVRAKEELLQFFADAGLTLESEEDLTEEFLDTARQSLKRLAAVLNDGKLDIAAARELAWEVEAWRMRLRLLAQRRLERRRFILRKPAEGEAQTENANAPDA